MKKLEVWLAEYSESHRNPVNRRIHQLCVPLILWSAFGFLTLPRLSPEIISSAAIPLSVLALLFYARLGLTPFFQMLCLLGACLGACVLLEQSFSSLAAIYGTVFFVAWIGQFVGHKIEGKKPSFFQDLFFLLIGPLWILRKH